MSQIQVDHLNYMIEQKDVKISKLQTELNDSRNYLHQIHDLEAQIKNLYLFAGSAIETGYQYSQTFAFRVEGERLQISEKTVKNLEDSYLDTLLKAGKLSRDKPYVIDRNLDMFKSIIKVMQTRTFERSFFPKNVSDQEIETELMIFHISKFSFNGGNILIPRIQIAILTQWIPHSSIKKIGDLKEQLNFVMMMETESSIFGAYIKRSLVDEEWIIDHKSSFGFSLKNQKNEAPKKISLKTGKQFVEFSTFVYPLPRIDFENEDEFESLFLNPEDICIQHEDIKNMDFFECI